MSNIAITEILNLELLTHFLERVTKLDCRILNAGLEPILTSGNPAQVPNLTPELMTRLTSEPSLLHVDGGMTRSLFQGGTPIGYIVVGVKNAAQVGEAEFLFQFIEDQIRSNSSRAETEFDVAYLQNLVRQIQKLSQKLAQVFEEKAAAEILLKDCPRIFAAHSGAVVILDRRHQIEARVDHGLRVLASYGDPFDDFETVSHISYSRNPVLCNDPKKDPLFTGKNTRFQNLLVVPLFGGEELIGAIYLRDKEIGDFTIEDQKVVQTLGSVLGGLLATIQLHRTLVENERVKSNLERYLSPNLVKEVISSGQSVHLGGQMMPTVVFFSDIRGFTKMSENYTPEVMVSRLNEYFQAMTTIVFAHEGTLDKFVGDLIMVLFGVPRPIANPAVAAIQMAIEMQKQIRKLNEKWAKEDFGPFGVGMGINFGEVVFGNIGSKQAMGLTVIGDHVNQAQRLEAYAKAGEILISEAVYKLVFDKGFQITKIGRIEVKGKQIEAYSVSY